MPLLGYIRQFSNIALLSLYLTKCGNAVCTRIHVVLSLKQQARNSCNAPENVLCPAVIMSPQTEAPPDFKSAPF